MAARDIFDDVIEVLERESLAGRNRVHLDKGVAEAFFSPVDRSAAAPEPLRPGPAGQVDKVAGPAETGHEIAELPRRSRPTPPGNLQSPAPRVSELGWEALEQRVSGCTLCSLHRTRTNAVFGEVNREAQLMFVGEGPGFHEDQSGRPFVGPAGQLLDKMIVAMQYSRQSVYIANVVKCRPPGNRNPNDQEAAACLPYLNRQIELVQPQVLVLLGAVPLLHLLHKTGITRLHGQWFEYRNIPVMPTFHPSYLLRSPARKKEAWQDLQKVMAKLGKDPEITLRQMRKQSTT